MADLPKFKQLVIHGNKSRAKTQGYTSAVNGDYTKDPGHYNGNPAFCMYLKVDKLQRSTNNSVKCTINAGHAYLCKFPMSGSHYFGYSFKIYAGIYVGDPADFTTSSKVYSKTLLLSKPASARTWKSGYAKTTKDIKITSGADAVTKTKVYLVIFNVSKCSCNQTNKARPVAFVKLDTSSIAPAPTPGPEPETLPYVWRYRYVDISGGSKPSDWDANYGEYFTKTEVDAVTYTRNTQSSWTNAKSAEQQPTGIYRGEWYLSQPIYQYTYSQVTTKPGDWSTNWNDYCTRPDRSTPVYVRNTMSSWDAAKQQTNGIWKGEWKSIEAIG